MWNPHATRARGLQPSMTGWGDSSDNLAPLRTGPFIVESLAYTSTRAWLLPWPLPSWPRSFRCADGLESDRGNPSSGGEARDTVHTWAARSPGSVFTNSCGDPAMLRITHSRSGFWIRACKRMHLHSAKLRWKACRTQRSRNGSSAKACHRPPSVCQAAHGFGRHYKSGH
jgi:hypothetical protein